MSHEHHETIESTNRKNKNSSVAAFGFVVIVIVLIVSAANYLRIQAPRFQSTTETQQMKTQEATEHAVEADKTPVKQEHEVAAPEEDTQAH